jgi:hypothetical protein
VLMLLGKEAPRIVRSRHRPKLMVVTVSRYRRPDLSDIRRPRWSNRDGTSASTNGKADEHPFYLTASHDNTISANFCRHSV